MQTELAEAPLTLQPIFPIVEQQLGAIPGFEQASQKVARLLHETVLRGGDPARAVVDLFHGTWLGHPLHVVMVHIPLGAWISAAVFDGLALVTRSPQAAAAADMLIGLGVVSALPTSLAGLADYSGIPNEAASLAAAHASLNSLALGLYVLSLRARRNGSRGAGVALATVAFGTLLASAALGGDLVYRKQMGVDRNTSPAPTDGWVAVLPAGELDSGEARRVEIGDTPVLLYRNGDKLYAMGATCSHAGAPLEEGSFSGHCVECPWHHSVFDLRDGAVVHGPAVHPQPHFQARIRNGQVEVKI